MRALNTVFICFVLLGCSTIVKGTTQTVAVNTPGVEGATCVLHSSVIGSRSVITPATITLEKSKEAITVRCTKECYTDSGGIIPSNFEGMSAGNIILGGIIGLGVDAASGAMNQYAPEVQIVMTKIDGCGRAPERAARRTRRNTDDDITSPVNRRPAGE